MKRDAPKKVAPDIKKPREQPRGIINQLVIPYLAAAGAAVAGTPSLVLTAARMSSPAGETSKEPLELSIT